MSGLVIKKLKVEVANNQVIKELDLEVPACQVHVLMGPNGSGKSSLVQSLCGNPAYKIIGGEILWRQKNLVGMSADKIAREGVFMSFQSPVEIEGVVILDYLKMIYNNSQKNKNKDFQELKTMEFYKILQKKMRELSIPEEFASRYLNQGFSGGEKKKLEMLQMLLLEPKFIAVDEVDSGLDMDALKIVAKAINDMADKGACVLLITHYKRILEYISADRLHIMKQGKIIYSTGVEMIDKLEDKGFTGVFEEEEQESKGNSLHMLA